MRPGEAAAQGQGREAGVGDKRQTTSVEHDGRFCREIVEVDGRHMLCCAVDASEDGPIVPTSRLDGKRDFFVRSDTTCRTLNSKEMLKYVRTKWPGRGSHRGHTGCLGRYFEPPQRPLEAYPPPPRWPARWPHGPNGIQRRHAPNVIPHNPHRRPAR